MFCGNEFYTIADYCEKKYLFLSTLSLILNNYIDPTDYKMTRNEEQSISVCFLCIGHDSKAAYCLSYVLSKLKTNSLTDLSSNGNSFIHLCISVDIAHFFWFCCIFCCHWMDGFVMMMISNFFLFFRFSVLFSCSFLCFNCC